MDDITYVCDEDELVPEHFATAATTAAPLYLISKCTKELSSFMSTVRHIRTFGTNIFSNEVSDFQLEFDFNLSKPCRYVCLRGWLISAFYPLAACTFFTLIAANGVSACT